MYIEYTYILSFICHLLNMYRYSRADSRERANASAGFPAEYILNELLRMWYP